MCVCDVVIPKCCGNVARMLMFNCVPFWNVLVGYVFLFPFLARVTRVDAFVLDPELSLCICPPFGSCFDGYLMDKLALVARASRQAFILNFVQGRIS